MASDDAPNGRAARSHPDVEASWAAEAHRRWMAYQRGEEEMLPFDDVMAEIRASHERDRRTIKHGTSTFRPAQPDEGDMAWTVDQLESELRRQPQEVRDYLAEVLLDSLALDDDDEDAVEAEAHRRAMEVVRGEIEPVDADEVIAGLRARRRP